MTKIPSSWTSSAVVAAAAVGERPQRPEHATASAADAPYGGGASADCWALGRCTGRHAKGAATRYELRRQNRALVPQCPTCSASTTLCLFHNKKKREKKKTIK